MFNWRQINGQFLQISWFRWFGLTNFFKVACQGSTRRRQLCGVCRRSFPASMVSVEMWKIHFPWKAQSAAPRRFFNAHAHAQWHWTMTISRFCRLQNWPKDNYLAKINDNWFCLSVRIINTMNYHNILIQKKWF